MWSQRSYLIHCIIFQGCTFGSWKGFIIAQDESSQVRGLNVFYICVILDWLFYEMSFSHPKSGVVQLLVSLHVPLSLKICVCWLLKQSMIRNTAELFQWSQWDLTCLAEALYDFSITQVVSFEETEQMVGMGRKHPGNLTIHVYRWRECSNLNMKCMTGALERAVESNQRSQVKRGNGLELSFLSQQSCWEQRKWMCTF